MLSVYYGHPTNSGNRIPGPGSPAQNMDWIGLGLDWNVQLSPCFTTCPRRSTKRKLTDVPRLTDFRYNGLKDAVPKWKLSGYYRSSTRYNRNHDVFQFGQIWPSSFPAPQPSLQSACFLRLDASNDGNISTQFHELPSLFTYAVRRTQTNVRSWRFLLWRSTGPKC